MLNYWAVSYQSLNYNSKVCCLFYLTNYNINGNIYLPSALDNIMKKPIRNLFSFKERIHSEQEIWLKNSMNWINKVLLQYI